MGENLLYWLKPGSAVEVLLGIALSVLEKVAAVTFAVSFAVLAVLFIKSLRRNGKKQIV